MAALGASKTTTATIARDSVSARDSVIAKETLV